MNVENKNPKIFVIAGQARQGKDTIAKIIRSYYEEKGMKAIDLDFAHYIKEYAMRITNWDGSEDLKPREFLQYLGTDLIRKEIDSDIFIRRIIEDIKVFSYFYDIITLSDARFDQEVISVKQTFSNVCTIKVVRPGNTDALGTLSNHSTEHGLTKDEYYDYILINDGTIDELKEKVVSLLEG